MQTMDLIDVDHSLSTVSHNRPFILTKPSVDSMLLFLVIQYHCRWFVTVNLDYAGIKQ